MQPSKRLLYTLFAAQSLFSASQIAVFTLLTIVATQLSGTESLAGFPSSIITFARALAAYPIAAILMRRYGRRPGLALGYGLSALGGVMGMIAILQESFPLLLVSSILMGMARASSDQSRFAAGEMFPESERGRMIGRVIFAGTIGAVVGPALVAPSGEWVTALGLPADTGPWVAAIGLSGLAALITFVLLRPDPMSIANVIVDTEAESHQDDPQEPARPVRELLMLPTVQLAIMAMLISQTVMVVLMVMTPLHMEHEQYGRAAIALMISAHTLGMFGLSAVTGYMIDRFGRVRMIALGALILIASALLGPLATNEYVLALAMFLVGLGWNFGYVGGSSLLADVLQGAERNRVQGINDTLVFSVAGIGSLSAGPLFAGGGFIAISGVGLLLTLVMIGLLYRLTRPRLAAQAV